MHRHTILIALLYAGSLPSAMAARTGASEPAKTVASEPVGVAVSVPPQAYLVDRIGGDRVRTRIVIPPGASPGSYEPTPKQILFLSKVRLYIAVGHPGFPFEQRYLGALLAQHPHLDVLDMSLAIEQSSGSGAAATETGYGGHGDPHVWLSPPDVASSAIAIARSLEALDPEGAGSYRRNLELLLADIGRLDREIAAGFAGLEERTILVFHPAWGHFADRYGLEQVAIEEDGKEPSPAHLVELIEEGRRRGWRTIFVQRGFSDRSARVLARELGAEVVAIDPMAYDWLENLRAVAAAFRRALSDGELDTDRGGTDDG